MPSPDDLLSQLRLAAERKRTEAWRFFQPYPKQLEFLSLGNEFNERLLMAGNQLGKSECGAYEIGRHLTGEYPDWWQGRRWDRPVKVWAAGVTGVATRDVVQAKLCGPAADPSQLGTGQIPKAAFAGPPTAGRSAPNAFDTVLVKHKSGGNSAISFKTYEQGREAWQGATIDLVWFDEEPPIDVYIEGRTRFSATKGMSILTFTPLKGMSEVVQRFYPHPTAPNQCFVKMGIADALHFSPDEREAKIKEYPIHERQARANGDPLLGSGAIYSTPAIDLMEDPILDVPLHWAKLWGIDFGIDHPFAAVLIAWDRDADVVHVIDAVRMTGAIPLQHATALRRVAANVPVAWPHDGNNREKGSGEPLAAQYRKEGLAMLDTHSTHPTGGYSVEAGIMDLDRMMQARQFRVNRYLADWFNEYGMYHRDKGQIVKKNDDLMDATRMAVMMRRRARAVPLGGKLVRRREDGTPMAEDWLDAWNMKNA